MRIIITESQYGRIISESTLDSLSNVFTGKTMIRVISQPVEMEHLNLPKFSSSDDFITKLGKSPIKFSAFHIDSEGYRFPVFPLSLTGNYKGNTYRFSFEPFNKEQGLTMVNLKINLNKENKKLRKDL